MAGGSDSQKAKADDEAAGSVQTDTPTPAASEQDLVKTLLLQQKQYQQRMAQQSAVMTAMMEQLTTGEDLI
ncbi:hypothetical protein CYMTET_19520 [Cymbomonas tetramitiformis]|uniref:Uncharacterized protein n=1 Tax=Cymbomonas tetramitiformis TaxID=36881 RepID=A0AAE0G6E5_9CHLO|nr:hypothetical protein CYMTET_19520 [Cymbomonas tetramitiformis]